MQEDNTKKNIQADSITPFVGDIFREDMETNAEPRVAPILDMPSETSMLSEDEQKGLVAQPTLPREKVTSSEPPVLSLGFLDIETDEKQ